MSSKRNIRFQTIQKSNGPEYRVYVDHAADNGVATPQIFATTDAGLAKVQYNDLKQKYPNATVNGKKDYDPFGPESGLDNAGLGLTPQTEQAVTAQPPQNPAAASEDPYKTPTPIPQSTVTTENAKAQTKPARDISGVGSSRLQEYKNLSSFEICEAGLSGVGGQMRMQAKITFNKLECEELVARGKDNNAFIIIGNDRQTHRFSGYGGAGHTQCDMIDIVAGMGGSSPKETEPYYDEKLKQTVPKTKKYDPDFFLDAARIYISQKTDIDRNFGLRQHKNVAPFESKPNDPGPTGAKSAIGLKADNIRIISRETLDLVTGTDAGNSQKGDLSAEKTGINIIANNNFETLQPMVLGDNLQLAIDGLATKVEAVANVLYDFSKYQMALNSVLATHEHPSGFFGTIKAEFSKAVRAAAFNTNHQILQNTQMSLVRASMNMAGFRSKYLVPSGRFYIKSQNNQVN